MSEDKSKICVVGAGNWGKNHIDTLHHLRCLGGIVDSNKKLLNNFSKQHQNIKTYSNLEEAIKNKQFLGFIVATPAETHYKIAKKIINAGKHVLIEKPMTLEIRHAEELVKIAKEKMINIMVGHLLLFHPAIRRIYDIISDGRIGQLQYIYSNRLNLGKVRTKENVFWSLAPHDIAIFQYLAGEFPEKINAHGSSFLQKDICDSTITHLKYANGVEGHIFVSWLHPFKEHRLVVIGSKGMISFEDSESEKPLKLYSKNFDFKGGKPQKFDGPIDSIKYENKMALSEELLYFIKHLNGEKLKIANGDHAIQVIRILVEASSQIQ